MLGWEEGMGQGKVEEMERVEEMKVEEMKQAGLEGGSRGTLGGDRQCMEAPVSSGD